MNEHFFPIHIIRGEKILHVNPHTARQKTIASGCLSLGISFADTPVVRQTHILPLYIWTQEQSVLRHEACWFAEFPIEVEIHFSGGSGITESGQKDS